MENDIKKIFSFKNESFIVGVFLGSIISIFLSSFLFLGQTYILSNDLNKLQDKYSKLEGTNVHLNDEISSLREAYEHDVTVLKEYHKNVEKTNSEFDEISKKLLIESKKSPKTSSIRSLNDTYDALKNE